MDDRDTGDETAWSSSQGDHGVDAVRVLHIDPDREAREGFASVADSRETLSVESFASRERGRKYLDAADAVVVDTDVPTSPDDALLTGEHPTILYTDDDPWAVDDAVLGRADSLVEKGAAGSARFLLEKVDGIVRGRVEDSALEGARETLQSDLDGVAVFVVDDRGSVRWSNVALDTVFPASASPPDTDDFYEQMAALLSGRPQVLRKVLDAPHAADRTDGQLLSLPAEDGSRRVLHASYPLDEGGAGERLEVFVPVDGVFDRYERLGLFQELVDNAQDGLYVLDADGRIEYCNSSYAEIVGYDPEELVGQHASVLMAEGEIEAGQEAIVRSLEAGSDGGIVDMTLRHRDGSDVYVSIHGSVRRDDSGGYAGVMGVVRDITERKERERELEKYRNLVESAADPMYVLDEEGTIQVLNDAMADFVGREKNSLVGADVETLLPERSIEAGRDVLRRLLSESDAASDSFEMWMDDADGDPHFFEVTVSCLTEPSEDAPGEEFAGSVATYRDITERHRRQEELDLRKQIFARSLRHNIRNETSIIRSYGSILAEELDGERAEMAADIVDASRSLARTSEKVSQFDWLVEQEPVVVDHDLAPLVARCLLDVEDVDPAADIEVSVPGDVRVRAVRDIDVGIRNLLENALQHGTDGERPTITVEARTEGDEVAVIVADDGPGIPRSEVSVIQGGEETALHHASGLGLWLVRRVVNQSDGTIEFEVDDGTRVTVRLPRPE